MNKLKIATEVGIRQIPTSVLFKHGAKFKGLVGSYPDGLKALMRSTVST